MSYHMEIKEIEPIRIAFMRYKGLSDQANKVFPNVFKSISGRSNGAPFFCYYKMNPDTKYAEMELCVPTEEIPKVRALCTTHTGPYETLGNAYAAMEQYVKERNWKVQMPFREVYTKGPGMLLKANPQKYVTEIIFPICEGE